MDPAPTQSGSVRIRLKHERRQNRLKASHCNQLEGCDLGRGLMLVAQVDVTQALQSMRDTYEAPTARAEGAVFPSVMAAFFAVLALSSLGAAFLAVGGSRPRMATVATMALWCLVAVLMFLGAGRYLRFGNLTVTSGNIHVMHLTQGELPHSASPLTVPVLTDMLRGWCVPIVH